MTPAEEAKKLNEELIRLYRDMRPFFTPNPSDRPREWSQAEMEYYFGLYERVGKIIARLSDLRL
jgi:hypothetical protein